MPKPITRLNTQAKTKVGLRKGVSFTIGLGEKKERSRNSTNATADIQPAIAMPSSPNQSLRGPSSSTYSSPPRKIAIAAKWLQSIRANIAGLALSTRITKTDIVVTITPGRMLTKNSQRQSSASVISPPTVGPKVGAMTATVPRIAGIIARCLPVKMVKPTEKTNGTIAPPVKPCSARKKIIDPMLQARPHIRLEKVNMPAEKTNSQRVDIACAR